MLRDERNYMCPIDPPEPPHPPIKPSQEEDAEKEND